MLVTGDFVFVHVPKTGGTFIQSTLREHVPILADWDYAHTPYDELPPQWRDLPVFCVVRNPWDWYVSWFHYESAAAPVRKPRRWDAEKRAVWEGPMREGEASFKEAVARACEGDLDHPLAERMREDGIDLYSAQFRAITGSALERPDLTVLRFERLRSDLMRFLSVHSEVSKPLRRAIRRDPPRRSSEHEPYPRYYDDELAELVGEKARWLCERFGYTFDREAR